VTLITPRLVGTWEISRHKAQVALAAATIEALPVRRRCRGDCSRGVQRCTSGMFELCSSDRAGALEAAERRFLAAALDYGCTEIASRSRVSVVMRRLRSHLERQRTSKKKLEDLLHSLTEPD
jgi:hypothetical protein